MKEYTKPEMEVIEFATEVITRTEQGTSLGDELEDI